MNKLRIKLEAYWRWMRCLVLRLFHGFFSRFHDAALLAAIRRQDMMAIVWHSKMQNHHATRLAQISSQNSIVKPRA